MGRPSTGRKAGKQPAAAASPASPAAGAADTPEDGKPPKPVRPLHPDSLRLLLSPPHQLPALHARCDKPIQSCCGPRPPPSVLGRRQQPHPRRRTCIAAAATPRPRAPRLARPASQPHRRRAWHGPVTHPRPPLTWGRRGHRWRRRRRRASRRLASPPRRARARAPPR